MARKSNWLPGQSQQEPGADRDRYSFGYVGPGVTPLQDITTGVLLFLGAAVIAVLIFGLTPNLNLGASIVAGVAILMLLAGAAYTLQRGGRKWAWRKSHTSQTGGRYLRPWERNPPRQR
jgi:VIT1/CCC1 family predicted Fe2+/Mn2+ transporter